MLKGLDPRLGADVLHALRAMGHGDTLVVADTNFPARSVAAETVVGVPLTMENLTTAEAVEAILSVFPLDTFEGAPVARMEVVDAPDTLAEAQQEVADLLDGTMEGVERFAFYERAKAAYAVIQTGERRFYGCVILRKGVIGPEEL
ncbi:hypothetical protein JANAI62_12810 [Jannaschia pagri]|uniref:D-ribose pyranase n=1 Tax=Jannaschia pagri TaxID=2829797 RepID=A0ABQ4NJT3_9RHOB|nr:MULTISPECIES: RbsD/FucU domain-containing protein [unclassified Jannaschia]GIT90826.1 hypothetical protein JANAI61_12840 [Jannaschia sp. AI_61]GIT94658.1 hypothetical protein JANAI62_12810 [Jannaschia sp. AI_62]